MRSVCVVVYNWIYANFLKRGGGLFGSAEMTGSIGVVTLNMARIGYVHKGDEQGLFNRIDELVLMAKSTLEKKRVYITCKIKVR